MASNLRAKPIEGFVTDNSGNVLRNSLILIKEATPSGSNLTDRVTSDDDGYFVSKPIQSGTYDIYESGVRVSKHIHQANQHAIQCYATASDNIPEDLPPFYDTDYTAANDINKFRHYLQIEADDLDIKLYGHSFPIYEPNLMVGNLADFTTYHTLTSNSRITTTRFDVELFLPLTNVSTQYRRVRWVGVPAIRFFEDSRLVIPLNYYSIVANRPSEIEDFAANINFTHNDTLEVIGIYDVSDTDPSFTTLSDNIVKGDILKLTFDDNASKIFWGIFVESDVYSLHTRLMLKKWRSSNYISNAISGDLENMNYVTDVVKYSGMYNGMTNIGVSTNEKYTIVENVYAQDQNTELYNISDV